MKILAVDFGGGTQDLLLLDTRLDIENALKMIVPSPTMILSQNIRHVASRGCGIVLTGTIMGGGPVSWAIENHLKCGLPVFATPNAAKSINDDLEIVQSLGIHLISEDEAGRLPPDVQVIELKDLDFRRIGDAFSSFGICLSDLDVIAVCAFDHGDSPHDVSDRQFRFDYLQDRVEQTNDLNGFAFLPEKVPPFLTRLKAIATEASTIAPAVIVMDSAPAAVLGATLDPELSLQNRNIIANIGNFHTLAFRLGPSGIEGIFEHHTGFLNKDRLENMLEKLAAGILTRDEIYLDHGHGAYLRQNLQSLSFHDEAHLTITGPRRQMMASSRLKPHFACPFGDMMATGCFGLIAATSQLLPQYTEELSDLLTNKAHPDRAPWDVLDCTDESDAA